MRSVEELKNIRGKRVLVRVDFNVPVERGRVIDNTKISAAVPTLALLLKKGAKVILMTHLGRPVAKRESRIMRQELEAIVKRLGELLKKKVGMSEQWNFAALEARVKKMKAGDAFMLPNLRLHPGEEKNSAAFARSLAELGQVYVNEAFSVCHRKHASVVGVPKFLPAYAGLRLTEEVATLSRVLHTAQKPLVVLMGGGKITDKLAMVQSMARRANMILLGGALATNFFKALGFTVGASQIEPEGVRRARALLKNKKILLPRDVVVGKMDGSDAMVIDLSFPRTRESTIVDPRSRSGMTRSRVICEKPLAIWDVGPQTILDYAKYIKQARTLIWNGPLGRYEVKRYCHGTLALGRLFAARSKGKAFGVIGGGETIDAMGRTGLAEWVDFISTGGGAMLEFLSGKKLPGMAALYARKS